MSDIHFTDFKIGDNVAMSPGVNAHPDLGIVGMDPIVGVITKLDEQKIQVWNEEADLHLEVNLGSVISLERVDVPD